ncbi:hypothetical protein KAFR_0D04300 [Kazachstania africana CBS 2517]|uniref:Uncharacterized protein n=1 Tax=Kazachstania africana (strain ATCC 22294 / BCRC 22015 / CBS 2517 / CECT 1963 / NBRC 1671 / NRRL Y-8276) TaxID=1071382 RepID=H2AUM8_KAZAF|nr:hypothetical protein KAFR_0D04300 [Kazachstania africana CBS 2517]CCF58078.1 hypothetical protein KAFR_0D04300 [Kazachstania africana CBS 2517]
MMNTLTQCTSRCVGPFIARRSFNSGQPLQSLKAIKFLKAQKRRQENVAKKAKLNNSTDFVDPVFGRKNTPFIARIMAEIKEPSVLAKGYDINEVNKLFVALESTQHEQAELSDVNSENFEPADTATLANRREALLRILSMRNASNRDSMKVLTRLAREEFQRFPGDTGSSEVQAACITVKILNIASHVQNHRKDHANTRILRQLVQQRQSILRYLKRDMPQRYYWTIEKLGLTDDAITNEFNLDRRYMEDYNFFDSQSSNNDLDDKIEN